MKNKTTFAIILVFFVVYFIFKNTAHIFGYILIESRNYTAFNENKKKINSRFFIKKKKSNNDKTFELIVFFNENLNYKYITIVPKEKLIGLPNQTNNNIIVFSNIKFAYLYPSGGYFTVLNDKINGVVDNFNFSNNIITFNTFGELKKYGSNITIEKK